MEAKSECTERLGKKMGQRKKTGTKGSGLNSRRLRYMKNRQTSIVHKKRDNFNRQNGRKYALIRNGRLKK